MSVFFVPSSLNEAVHFIDRIYFYFWYSVAPLLASDRELDKGSLLLKNLNFLLQLVQSFDVNVVSLEEVESADVWVAKGVTTPDWIVRVKKQFIVVSF